MRLRLIAGTPDRTAALPGYMAQLFINDVDVSAYVRRVVVECGTDGPISATVEVFPSSIDFDVPADIKALPTGTSPAE